MIWNWQKPDWPDFSWDKAHLAKSEEQFLLETGVFVGTVKHLGPEDRDQLTVEAMSTEALTTSEIEGEILDRASVQSSIRKQLGLASDNRRVGPAEQGIAEMMVDFTVYGGWSPEQGVAIAIGGDVLYDQAMA
jgi:Fic family protein